MSIFLEMYLPNEEEYSRCVNKMLFYRIIGISCVAVVMVCLHVVLYFGIKLYPYKATMKMSISDSLNFTCIRLCGSQDSIWRMWIIVPNYVCFYSVFMKKAYIICYNASFGNKNTGIHIAYIMQCNKQDEKPRVGNF